MFHGTPVITVQPDGLQRSVVFVPVPLPVAVKTLPLGRETDVLYHRPPFMFCTRVQVLVRQSNTLAKGVSLRPPFTMTRPSGMSVMPPQNMSCVP